MSNEFINTLTKELMDSSSLLTVLTTLIILMQTYFRNRRHYSNIIFILLVSIVNIITLGFIIYCYVNKLPLESNDVLFHIVCCGAAFIMLRIALRQDRLLTQVAERQIEINVII